MSPFARAYLGRYLSVSLGASVCSREGEFDLSIITSIARQFRILTNKGCSVAAVVGSGGASKSYLRTAAAFETNSEQLDRIAIRVSQLNAMLLIAALEKEGVLTLPDPLAAPGILALPRFRKNPAVVGVFGGLRPGFTCDSSAALISKKLRAPLLLVSTKGQVFEKDPEQSKSPPLLALDRSYLRVLLRDKPARHVLDSQTCRLLLKMPHGFLGAVTAYKNIERVGSELLKGNSSQTKKATWIRL